MIGADAGGTDEANLTILQQLLVDPGGGSNDQNIGINQLFGAKFAPVHYFQLAVPAKSAPGAPDVLVDNDFHQDKCCQTPGQYPAACPSLRDSEAPT